LGVDFLHFAVDGSECVGRGEVHATFLESASEPTMRTKSTIMSKDVAHSPHSTLHQQVVVFEHRNQRFVESHEQLINIENGFVGLVDVNERVVLQ